MLTIQLPTLFYDDHVQRDLPGGALLDERGNLSTVLVDRATFLDLLGDAKLYAGFDRSNGDYQENRSVCDSATRAYARLLKYEAPEAPVLGTCQHTFGRHNQSCGETVYADTYACVYCGTPFKRPTNAELSYLV